MLYKLINKQLFEIAKRNNLNYSHTLRCFKLEDGNDKISRLSITFRTLGTYSLMIEINGNKKCSGSIPDVVTLFLLCVLKDKLNDNSFPDALKETYHQYEKTQKIIKELKNNENSTN